MAKTHNFYVVKVYEDMDELLGEVNEIPFQPLKEEKKEEGFKKRNIF
jgi:hypothetical protein